MFSFVLCWKYLEARRLTLLCIFGVLLGVAVLIVVHSVLHGFRTTLLEKLHRAHSDVVVKYRSAQGFDAERVFAKIRRSPYLDHHIHHITPTLETHAMLSFSRAGQDVIRPVKVVGVELSKCDRAHWLVAFLFSPNRRANPSFQFDGEPDDSETPKVPVILGYGLGHRRGFDPDEPTAFVDVRYLHPGDAVRLSKVQQQTLTANTSTFVVCDYLRTELTEIDEHKVVVPLQTLQRMQNLRGRATTLYVQVRGTNRSRDVAVHLERVLGSEFSVERWEENQGPLLSAIRIESGLLMVFLFLIVVVAGFTVMETSRGSFRRRLATSAFFEPLEFRRRESGRCSWAMGLRWGLPERCWGHWSALL